MKTCAIVGINWGDEGKGRVVDLLTADYDIVIRYQGGGNAGHTVINDKGKFALHLLPSGIFHEGVVNILGNGVALDPENLWKEITEVVSKGVPVTPDNLKISDRASLLLPWHRDLDALEEQRLADRKYGSTKQGIAPFYSDKYQKKTVMAGELFHPEALRAHLAGLAAGLAEDVCMNLNLQVTFVPSVYENTLVCYSWSKSSTGRICFSSSKSWLRSLAARLHDSNRSLSSSIFLNPKYKPSSVFSVMIPQSLPPNNSIMPEHSVVTTGNPRIMASVAAVLYPSATDEQTKMSQRG